MIVELKFGVTSRQLNHFKQRALLGRDERECDVWVEDPSVSRRHAEVWLEGETCYIRDLGSANGTWVNGQPLGAHPVPIMPCCICPSPARTRPSASCGRRVAVRPPAWFRPRPS